MEQQNSRAESYLNDEEQIVIQVKFRWRIVRCIMLNAAFWTLSGTALYFFWLGPGYGNDRLRWMSFVLEFIGYALMLVAFSLQFAIYRCPVCDSNLAKKFKDKNRTHCPGCNVRIRRAS